MGTNPIDFIKRVGKGKTLSQHLSIVEAREAFSMVLQGVFSPVQLGAFLQALRIHELSQEELDGLIQTFHAQTNLASPLSGSKSLVLNMASDTPRKGGLVSLLAAHLLGRFGVGVGLIRSAPVLSGNKASFDQTLILAKGFDPTGPLFPFDGNSVPGPSIVNCGDSVQNLSSLDSLRSELGFRSCLHTAEKLVNPWPTSPLLLGISHKHYAMRMAQTMASMGLFGAILLGNHGTVDLVLHKETEYILIDKQGITEKSISPEALGLRPSPEIYTLGKFPDWGQWLTGSRDNGLFQAVQYHLAVFLSLSGTVSSPVEGLALARSVIPKLF